MVYFMVHSGLLILSAFHLGVFRVPLFEGWKELIYEACLSVLGSLLTRFNHLSINLNHQYYQPPVLSNTINHHHQPLFTIDQPFLLTTSPSSGTNGGPVAPVPLPFGLEAAGAASQEHPGVTVQATATNPSG